MKNSLLMAMLGLVTVLYNSNNVLQDFFKSLSIQSYKEYHLFLIDNSPSDETNKLISLFTIQHPVTSYTHIKNKENYGVATGNNQGIRLSLQQGAEYVCLLNNDIDFSNPHLLKDMMEHAMRKEEDIVIPKIFYYGTRKIWLAGGKFLHYKGTSETFGDKEEDSEKYNEPMYFEYAPTCFMLISKKVFNKIGLMDERYFVYFDDNDFILRAIRASFKIWYMPSLEVFHKVSCSTGGSASSFSVFYLNRNRIYLIRKLYDFPMKHIALGQALITQSIRYLQYDKKKKQTLYKAFKEGFRMPIPSSEQQL